MKVHQVRELSPGTPVWVWIVRMNKGRWWPGSVISITARDPFPIVDSRFECRSAGKNGNDGSAFVGISTTQMSCVELRHPRLRGDDRPTFVPSGILAKPEQTEVGPGDVQHLDTMTADAEISRLPSPAKKSRSKTKAKDIGSAEDATVVTIES